MTLALGSDAVLPETNDVHVAGVIVVVAAVVVIGLVVGLACRYYARRHRGEG